MRASIFSSLAVALALAVSATACGGGDKPPAPLGKRFDDMYIARIPLDQKQAVIESQNEWSVAKMEHAKAEADLAEAKALVDGAKNDRKIAKINEDTARSNKKAAEASADTNRIGQASRDLRGAELATKAGDQRVKYLEAYRAWLQKLNYFTQEQMFFKEARYELAKAQIAQSNNIAPAGFAFADYQSQEQTRVGQVEKRRTVAEEFRAKAMTQRDQWMALQKEANELLGTSPVLVDPMSPKPAPTENAPQPVDNPAGSVTTEPTTEPTP